MKKLLQSRMHLTKARRSIYYSQNTNVSSMCHRYLGVLCPFSVLEVHHCTFCDNLLPENLEFEQSRFGCFSLPLDECTKTLKKQVFFQSQCGEYIEHLFKNTVSAQRFSS